MLISLLHTAPRRPSGHLYTVEINVYSVASSSLILAMASAGFKPFGQVREPNETNVSVEC